MVMPMMLQKIVLLDYKVIEDTLVFTISDEGNGFNLDSVPDPTLPENLENIKGRGIFLIRNLADKVTFEDRGAIIMIQFNLK
jgi:serine/threonine-protein kinase RsbW